MMKFIKIVFFTLCVYQLDSSRSRSENSVQTPTPAPPNVTGINDVGAGYEDDIGNDEADADLTTSPASTGANDEGSDNEDDNGNVEADADQTTSPASTGLNDEGSDNGDDNGNVDCNDCNGNRKHSHSVGQYIIEHIHEHTAQHVHLIAKLFNRADVDTVKPDQVYGELVKNPEILLHYGIHVGDPKNYENYMSTIADMIKAKKESKKSPEQVFIDLGKVLEAEGNKFVHTHTYKGVTIKHKHYNLQPHRHQVVDKKLDPKPMYDFKHHTAPDQSLVMVLAELFKEKPDKNSVHDLLWNYMKSLLHGKSDDPETDDVNADSVDEDEAAASAHVKGSVKTSN